MGSGPNTEMHATYGSLETQGETPLEVKPGYQTTEFYSPYLIAGVVGIVLPIINSRFNLTLDQTDVVNAVLAIGGALGLIFAQITYIIGRAKVKASVAAANGEIAKASLSNAAVNPQAGTLPRVAKSRRLI